MLKKTVSFILILVLGFNLSSIACTVIAVGKKANLFITKPIPSYTYLPYNFGHNVIDRVMINGKIKN